MNVMQRKIQGVPVNLEKSIKMKKRKTSRKLGVDDRVEHSSRTSAYVNLKDHNEQFFVNRYNA